MTRRSYLGSMLAEQMAAAKRDLPDDLFAEMARALTSTRSRLTYLGKVSANTTLEGLALNKGWWVCAIETRAVISDRASQTIRAHGNTAGEAVQEALTNLATYVIVRTKDPGEL